MRLDLVVAGVGGQGALSLAALLAAGAAREGLRVKQSEVHGMSQRGGAVVAHLRLADGPIASALIPRGAASMIVGMEPVESLRYLPWLSPGGTVIASSHPVENVPDYPPIEEVLAAIRGLPRALLVDSQALARRAGAAHAESSVMAGAASARLPIRVESFEQAIRDRFAGMGARTVDQNLLAFRLGREAAG